MYDASAFRERIPKLVSWTARGVITANDAALQYMDYLASHPFLITETYAQLSDSIRQQLSAIASSSDRSWYLRWFSIPGQCIEEVEINDTVVKLIKRVDGASTAFEIQNDHPARVCLRTLRNHLGSE